MLMHYSFKTWSSTKCYAIEIFYISWWGRWNRGIPIKFYGCENAICLAHSTWELIPFSHFTLIKAFWISVGIGCLLLCALFVQLFCIFQTLSLVDEILNFRKSLILNFWKFLKFEFLQKIKVWIFKDR